MRLALRYLIACWILLLARPVFATHNEAGEILVCHLGGLEYEVTIVTHTNPNSQADRPEFVIEWGDGELDTVPRLSDTILTFGSVQVKRMVLRVENVSGPVVTSSCMGVLLPPPPVGRTPRTSRPAVTAAPEADPERHR